jgi:prepilin-type N-terminal cleavage/methylation domain-containing protein
MARDKSKAFTLIEVLVSVALLGALSFTLCRAFATLSIGRLRADINMEAVSWHNNYAMGLYHGDFDRAAVAGGHSNSSFSLPSGLTITVVDVYSAAEPSMPNALYIQSTATWSLPNGSGSGSSVLSIARGTAPTTY